MKGTISALVFILTFGLSIALVGLLFGFDSPSPSPRVVNTQAAEIEAFLRRDIENGEARNYASQLAFGEYRDKLDSNENYRYAVTTYVARSSSMDYRKLPLDFQYAWKQHMNAWKKKAAFEQNKQAEFSPADVRLTAEINSTWNRVLAIAHRHGVQIDSSYYN
ncbi:MAG: hypothetical protein ACK5NT_05195 [Pyrinomonadaceae bacterium]